MRRFTPSPFDAGPQYGGALSIPAVAKMLPTVLASATPSKKNPVPRMAAKAGLGAAGRGAVKTVKRGLKREAQGLAWSTVQLVLWRNVRNEALPTYWVCKEKKGMYVPIRERPLRRRGLRGPPGQRGGNILWMSCGVRPYKRIRRPRRAKRLKRR